MNVILLVFGLLSSYIYPSSSASLFSDSAVSSASPYGLLGLSPPAYEAAADNETAAYIPAFTSLGGVRLFATEAELTRQKGAPRSVSKELWQGCLEYRYDDLDAGICGGVVRYIHVSPAQAARYGLDVSGTEIDPLRDRLEDVLGSPDFRAEDGNVYLRGEAALKVYLDPATGGWAGIDLFDKYLS